MTVETASHIHQEARKQCLLDAAEGGHETVRELAEETDMPKRSARRLVNELLDADRLEEVGTTAAPENAPIYALTSGEASR